MATNQQDVKVRLSAEGVADVVAAFTQVSNAAKKSSKESSEAFAAVGESAKELGKELLGGLGIALVIDKFKELFDELVDTGDHLEKLSGQTGLSTTALQGLQRAARQTDTDNEALNTGLNKLAVNLGAAQNGSSKMVAALSGIGLSIKDLQGLNPDKQFETIARQIAGIEDPARRARAEVDLFGKSGQQLDLLLRQVGAQGLDPFVQKLKNLGVFLDENTLAQMSKADDAFKDLGDEVKGVATQFALGLIPAVQQGVDALVKSTTGASNGLKAVGTALGDVFKGVLTVIIIVGKTIGTVIGAAVSEVKTYIDGLSTTLSKVKEGDFSGAAAAAKQTKAQMKDIAGGVWDQIKTDAKQTVQDLFADTGEVAAEAGKNVATQFGNAITQEMVQLARARAGLINAQLDNELKLYQAHAQLLETEEKDAYDQGAKSLTDYYADRTKIINDGFDKQEAIARQRIAAAKAVPVLQGDDAGAIAKQTELTKLNGDLQLLSLQRAQALAQVGAEERQAQETFYQTQIKTEERLLQLQGDKAGAAKLELDLQTHLLDQELKRAGVAEQERAAAVARFQQQGTSKINFDDASGKAEAALSSLQSGIKDINSEVASGQLFAIQGEQKIIALEQQRLPGLQAQAAAMAELARQTGDAQDVAKAEAYAQKVKEIQLATDQTALAMGRLKQAGQDALEQGFSQFLTNVATRTESVKDAFLDMARSIVTSMAQAAAQLLAHRALMAIFGGGSDDNGASKIATAAAAGQAQATPLEIAAASMTASGATITAASAALGVSAVALQAAADTLIIANSMSMASGYATGGYVSGPGTSTSDSIPAQLSDGEFVVKASSVRMPGVRDLLESINGGRPRGRATPAGIPKYASGGMVSSGGARAPVIKLVNVTDPTVLGDHLASPEGEQAVLNIISRNPTKVRQAIR